MSEAHSTKPAAPGKPTKPSKPYPECCGPPPDSELWQCTLFGPPAAGVENTALRQFSMFAEDAARLILPRSKAEGKALLSRWLIYIANRPVPRSPRLAAPAQARSHPLRSQNRGCFVDNQIASPISPVLPG